MKRPLFYWVSLFALGEVLSGVIPIEWIGLSMILIFLALCLTWGALRRKHGQIGEKCRRQGWILAMGFLFLMLGMFCMGKERRKVQECRQYREGTVWFQGRIKSRQSRTYGDCYIVSCHTLEWERHEEFPQKSKTLYNMDVILYPNAGETFLLGSLIAGRGVVKPFSQASNPGEYDEEKTRLGNGVYLALEKAQIQQIYRPLLPVREWLAGWREHFSEVYGEILSERNASLARAMVLGDKEGLDQEIKALYQENGIAHLIAMSGLHIAMIGGGLYQLLRKKLGGYVVPAAIGISFITAYGVMTGLSGATLRAILMIIISIGAELCGRRYDMLTAIAAALLFMLIANPFQCTQAGFLLSFGAVFGIAAIGPLWKIMFPKLPVWLEGLCISISVQMVILPVILYYFYEVPVYGVLLNLLVVPLMEALLPLLLFGGVMGSFLPGLASVAMLPANGIFKLYEAVCRLSSRLPFHTLCTGRPPGWWLAAYYGGLLIFLAVVYRLHGRERKHKGQKEEKEHKRRAKGKHSGQEKQKEYKRRAQEGNIGQEEQEEYRRRMQGKQIKKIGISVFLFYGLLFLSLYRSGNLTITVLDVGQGDGIYIQTPGKKHILMDGGSSSKANVGKYVIANSVRYYGGERLDYVFISHSDSDHYSGVAELLESGELEIRNIVLPDIANPDEAYRNLVAYALKSQCKVYYMKRGDSLQVDGVRFQCLHPEHEEYPDKNTGSLVLALSYGRFDMLFTGDLDKEGEKKVTGTLPKRRIEVLKAAHHGSATSSSEEFLKAVVPDAVCISVGKKNRYGHPAPEVMKRLAAYADKIYLTKEHGAITIETDGRTYRLRTFKQSSD